jgi:hypothetical protein
MAGTYHVQIRLVPADRAATDAVPLSQVVLQHHRTAGIQIDAQPLTGGHLLHLAVVGCIFNDLYHLAADRGIRLTDVRVAAAGGFEGKEPTVSTGGSPTRWLSPARPRRSNSERLCRRWTGSLPSPTCSGEKPPSRSQT